MTDGFEPEQLRRWLASHFGAEARFTVERITGGQSNPTFFVTSGDRDMVLRKKPAGEILPGAHAIEREFRVLEALSKTAVPVPAPLHFHTDATILGTPFYLMQRLRGRVFHDCALPGCTPEQRRHIYLAMAEVLAKLHAVDPAAIGLGDFGRPGNYVARQLARWTKQWQQSDSPPIAERDRLVGWLERNIPDDDGQVAIVHGDFRLGNLMFDDEARNVIGILDWELSTLGHPLADLGFACMPWHTSAEEYGGIKGLDHAALGIPSQEEFVRHYLAHAAPTAPLDDFYIVFALFRFAVIFVGIADRARRGNAAGADASRLGGLARSFARRALQLTGEDITP